MQAPEPWDPEYISAIYQRHIKLVYQICLLMLKNVPDAEDAAQTVFRKLLERQPVLRNSEHEKAWLIVTASNTCKDALRRASRRDEPLELRPDLPAPASADPAGNTVLDAVLALPLKYRAPVYLYYYEGYSAKEIAALLGEKPATIFTRLDRGRQKLRTYLEQEALT